MTVRHGLILTALVGIAWSPAVSATYVSEAQKSEIRLSGSRVRVAESDVCGIARIRCGFQERECMLHTSMWKMEKCYKQHRACMRQNGCNK